MNRILVSVIAVVGMFLSACITLVREMPSDSVEKGKDAPYALAVKVLESVLKNDPSGLYELLTPELRSQFDRKEFENSLETVKKSVGEPETYQFLTKLEMTTLQPYVWKIRCKHKNVMTGEEHYNEVMFRVIIGITEKGPIVLAYNFL